MQTYDSPLKLHVFVCTNQKNKNSETNFNCCANLDAEDLRMSLKKWADSIPEFKNKIRINKSGCLGQCDDGIIIAIYPHNKWIKQVKKSDLSSIQAMLSDLMKT